MADAVTDFIKFTTPAAQAIWPKLSKPDSYKNGPLNYNVKLRLPADDPFVEELREHAERCFAEQKAKLLKQGKKKEAAQITKVNYPYAAELDDDGEPTGFVRIMCKRDAVKFDKTTKQEIGRVTIPIFDGSGARVEGLDIWGGSIIRVSGWVSSYAFPATNAAGAALRITAVQVLKLVTAGGGDAADYGFGTDGDAIEAPKTGAEAEKTDATSEEGEEPSGDGADF